ncbi:MAG: response regulator [Oligoflexia bacterium]|nr:response regulator [Oligoflexia bacterium]
MTADKLKWILIVEDDQDLRETLAKYLTEKGFRAVSSSKITDALNKVNNQKFNCILLDIKFDYRSGDHVIEYLRSDDANPNHDTPILVMSGFLEPVLIKKIAKLVNGILVKPFEKQTLLDRINAVISAPDDRMAKS